MAEAKVTKKTVAVIDIGTSAIRLLIAEIGSDGATRDLENLHRPVQFGKDVFTTGRISSQEMRLGISILKDFKSVCDDYGVSQIQAVATSAVREAINRETFIDQVFVRTGIDIEILEGPEENRLELIAVQKSLGNVIDLDATNCAIAEVGSGSTELMFLQQGSVEVTRTLALGSLRLPENAVAGKTDSDTLKRVLKRNIHDVATYIQREYNLDKVNTFIALGGDMRFVCRQLASEDNPDFASVTKKAFFSLVQKIGKLQPEDVVEQYGISYSRAETLYATLLVYKNLLSEINVETIHVPMTSIRDALILELAQLYSGYKRTDLSKQVINSARHLGEKYQYDKTHAHCVASLSVKLFDALKRVHGLETRERLLLEVSATLHDIGTYIAPTSHHKHSSYLIQAAEIFGIRKRDRDIVANVVRYHRRSVPKATHTYYMSLPRNDRAIVSKLSAILRVADALDHSHQQKIRNFTLEEGESLYTLWVPKEVGDFSIERQSLREKGRMFEEVFGIPIALKHGAP